MTKGVESPADVPQLAFSNSHYPRRASEDLQDTPRSWVACRWTYMNFNDFPWREHRKIGLLYPEEKKSKRRRLEFPCRWFYSYYPTHIMKISLESRFKSSNKRVAPRRGDWSSPADGRHSPWASVAHCLPRVAVAATHLNRASNTLLLLRNEAQPGKEWIPLRQYLCCSVVTAVNCACIQHLVGAIKSWGQK